MSYLVIVYTKDGLKFGRMEKSSAAVLCSQNQGWYARTESGLPLHLVDQQKVA